MDFFPAAAHRHIDDSPSPPSLASSRACSDSERDSDDEDEEEVETDELYDEEEDDKMEGEIGALPSGQRHGETRLSCPSCFATLCTDCQRHSTFKNQWRAMFVTDACSVDRSAVLRPAAVASPSLAGGGRAEEETVCPVTCGACGATVGCLDGDDVYHFFGVIPAS